MAEASSASSSAMREVVREDPELRMLGSQDRISRADRGRGVSSGRSKGITHVHATLNRALVLLAVRSLPQETKEFAGVKCMYDLHKF